jgi:predicted AAA+ superfamily ATPase
MIEAQRKFVEKSAPVIIDEIQRVPDLLNEVHRLIEAKGFHFLLTGSSARKLRREGANMLAGRAWRVDLYPLVTSELPDFDLDRALLFGTLPPVWTSKFPADELDAYVTTYLKEEIQLEANLRNLPAFSRFLKVAALSSGQLINYAQLASDAAIPETTTKSYFQILTDTLLGFTLEPFIESKKRKAIRTGKFYLFDNGVRNSLLRLENLDRNSDNYGLMFEAFLAQELQAYISYRRLKRDLCFWRSTSQFEVDFVVGREIAIDVKSSDHATNRDLKGLKALAEEGIFSKFYLVSQDEVEKEVSIGGDFKVQMLHWKNFLSKLWGGKILS